MIFLGATAHHGLLRRFNFTRWCRAANCPSAVSDLLVIETTSALRGAPRTGKLEAAFEHPRCRRRIRIFGLEPRPRRPRAIRCVEPF